MGRSPSPTTSIRATDHSVELFGISNSGHVGAGKGAARIFCGAPTTALRQRAMGHEDRRMPTFTAADGTELAYHLRGEGEPLIVLPGGPMQASSYLGDLGGLATHRRLVLLDLRGTGDSAVPADPATYRCDRPVADGAALGAHLAPEL